MERILSLIFLIICGSVVRSYDEIDLEVESNTMLKILRDMANQTKADTLNLPANASSIRENITDTFSCENRTYGYYADVDNECQVFHVCVPTQTPSGRSITYRYSFICPNETIFNQEVMTCTRPRDSIECEESPAYYSLNEEIGKVPNKTEEQPPKTVQPEPQKPEKRKQNFIIEDLMKGVVNDGLRQKLLDFAAQHTEDIPESPEIEELEDLEGRIALERRVGRKIGRGSFRFKGDA